MEYPTAKIVQPRSNGWIPIVFGTTAFLVFLSFSALINQGQQEATKKEAATKTMYEQCKQKTQDVEWCVIAFHPNL